MKTDDCEIWERVRAGSQQAVGELFGRYADELLAYGMKLCQDRETVKDSIQNIFLEIINSARRLNQIQHVKSYLFKSLRRELASQTAKAKRFRLNEDMMPFYIQFDEEAYVMQDDEELLRQERRILLKAIASLTARQKEVVYLHYIQGLPLDSVCDIMCLNYQSTRNLLHKAICRLRAYFGSTGLISRATLLAMLTDVCKYLVQ